MRIIFGTIATIGIVLGLASPVFAQSQMNGPPRQPPPHAFTDCAGHQAGDVVQITPPGRAPIQATCTASPQGLFARPVHPPGDMDRPQMGGREMGPPPDDGHGPSGKGGRGAPRD
jgi:hypothetical protein